MKLHRIRNSVLNSALALILFGSSLTAQEKSDRTDFRHTILVTGNGEAGARPDRAVVRLGAMSQTSQAETAQAKVNDAMQKALDGIAKLGVQKSSIRAAALRLMPVYSTEKFSSTTEGQKVVGFRASNTLEITLDDLNLVGKVIDAGITAGLNEVQGVSFSLKNDLPQRTAALTEAAQEARAKAETIAKALGLTLAGVSEVTESGVHMIPLHENFGGARMMAASVQTPVEPGEVRVQANVTVRYEFNGPR